MSLRQIDLKPRVLQLPNSPGVYQFYNADEQLIYVGKARRLRQRVKSYFSSKQKDRKTSVLMQQVVDIKITVTNTENEALLLESNLIKQYRPRYNVVFRDDKSYPYLFLSLGDEFPRLDFHRGAKRHAGRYFGPYPSAGAVRENLQLIQKLFKLRQCTDIFFQHRTRPCLQYQIKRCTAPCVGYVQKEDYAVQVQHTLLFLEGKSQAVIDDLVQQMQQAADQLQYEMAGYYRDQIATLRKLQTQQYIVGDTGNIDIVGVAAEQGHIAISVLFVRAGRLLGQKTFFPQTKEDVDTSQALEAFISQYYLNPLHDQQPLDRIILTEPVANKNWLQSVLREAMSGKVVLTEQSRGEQFQQWQQLAKTNAQHALQVRMVAKLSLAEQFDALQKTLKLATPIQRVECFDASHTSGEATVVSCIVFDQEGPVKAAYRRYNIHDVIAGDDYAALQQALTRHYVKLKETEQGLPDLLMIDGGKGQLARAVAVLEELQVSGVLVLAISKGPSRKPGLEQLWLPGHHTPLQLSADHSVLHLLQSIRDEAHRFAITGHRLRRGKARQHSTLEDIPGVGAKRRRDLLNYFAGWQGLAKASVSDIAKVPGISVKLAQTIYDFYH